MRWARATALLGIASSLALGTAAPPATAADFSWPLHLAGGEAAWVAVDGGAARLDPVTGPPAATDVAPAAGRRVTGLLTFPPRRLEAPAQRFVATITGEVPADATATVDVRGRRANGRWTEWIPADPGPAVPPVPRTAVTPQATPEVTLPTPSTEVQGRLVLAGDPTAGPVVRAVTLTAHPTRWARAEQAAPARSYRVFATREGLVGRTTANGHVIAERDHFVALPSRRALGPRGSSDYSVEVCAPSGRCAFAPVWDIGPWNTRDDYWNPSDTRQEWRDLPQGLPQAQAAHQCGYNDGRDQYGRTVTNPAGIDLADGLFWDALGLTDNSWVTVQHLWMGSTPLARVEGTTDVRAAPDGNAEAVGLAAEAAAVPVECALDTGAGRWLRIGTDQYLPATSVADPDSVTACPEPTPSP